jgi:imidazolonepropionase-like amidohydrolase
MIAMLRQELIRAREYQRKQQAYSKKQADDSQSNDDNDRPEPPDTDLRLQTLVKVLEGELPLLITADRAQDISSALRLAAEFQVTVWLDSAAESYLLIDDIKRSGSPVIIHPTMARSVGERENMSFETASKLVAAGIPVAMQSGYESYVPKTRVVLFEAGIAAANGLTFEQALSTITIDAAKILGIADRVGSIEVSKDGDLALFDGDPFEYTTHCVGVVIDGEVVSRDAR